MIGYEIVRESLRMAATKGSKEFINQRTAVKTSKRLVIVVDYFVSKEGS